MARAAKRNSGAETNQVDKSVENVDANTEIEIVELEATEPEATEPEATEPEATEPEATEPEATETENYYVKEGKSITSKKGTLSSGQIVESSCFIGGDERLAELHEKGYLVKK